MPSPQPSPTGEGAGCSRFCGCRRFEKQLGFTVDFRSSEKQKAASTTYFSFRTLNPNSHPSSLPWERVRERATSRKACIGAVRVLGKVAAIWRMPSPQPSPTGEGAGCSRFCGCRRFEKQLGFTVDFRSSEKQKAASTTYFSFRTLNPNSHPSSLPWERVRERATSRKACIGAVRVLGKVAAIWRMPSPQPSPTGEGAGCSRFYGYRRFEKQLKFTTVDCRSSEK